MGLEKIVNAALKPFIALDSGLKLVHDGIAEVVGRTGKDRFTLAQYVGYGAGTILSIGGIMSIIGEYSSYGVAHFSSAAGTVFIANTLPKHLRDYFSGHENVLYESKETMFRASRIMRLPILLFGGLKPLALMAYPSPSTVDVIYYVTSSIGLVCISSSLYFMDGDHALWDKTKKFVENTYHKLMSLVPQPSPKPGPQPTISYGHGASA